MDGAKMTEESAVKVCVRVRPLIKREESESSEPVQLFWRADKQAIHQLDEDGAPTKSFSFDRVFSAAETTAQLYQDIAKPLVVSAVEGYNGTIFAYGQTSSGKTFSMMGSEHNPGVIPLAMADVFKTIKNFPKKEFLLRVSYMEIYNETVTDLLCDSWKRRPLEIREGNYKNVYVADLTEEMVTSPEQALSWITKGEKNRHYGKTKMNQRSSRSHTIFRMILESRDRSDPASGENADGAIIVSHLNLVDLAGAERASQTGAEGARLKEGCNINRSLFILGQVIKKLSDESQKGFVNYRDSKLTRILQNSLGGNAKTVIICTITPATVDETVSTLQFASAAKRMKNDPHVTEVSDEGALLKRYRNEIVDLRRRLQEVSSVTQTTETERESLCQLLQEKDQLQRDQQDRIKNLTKLLVTASNCALIPKVPKRRVTWGGKLLRSAHLLEEDFGSTDMSFAEPYIKKRRADCSLPEEGEDMDEFDSRFDFTAMDEPNMDMEMSSITVRSSSEGGNFLDSPRANELMVKVASLERQLDAETQSKCRAEEMSAELQLKVSELEDKLEARSTPSGQDQTLSELEELQRRLEAQVQERRRAEEKSVALELKLAELEKPSEALLRSQNTCEQLKRDLEEAIQLCETVGFEKDAVIAERDLAKHTLDQLTSDLERVKAEKDSLQKDKDALQKDIEERRDADEFEKLEEESKREYERELESENSRLKQDLKRSEEMIQQLKADLAMMSSELQKKTAMTAELQRFSDKDLVHEVTCLRRSLDDAETLSLETKKEWAFLRSENICLKERDVTLTTDHEKMEAVVKTLQDKLELEKSRFKKMQTDLQRELMGAFDENTKLTALLDGKVPKNLTDNLVLEKTLCDVRKELDQSLERERRLQSKTEEFETLSVKVEELQTQVCVLSEELSSAREERDALISAQSSVRAGAGETCVSVDPLLETESDLVEAQLKEAELTRQLTETSERLQNIQTDLQLETQAKHTLLAALEEATQKSLQLSSELECVCGERDALRSEMQRVQSEPDEMENLRRTIISKTEEREQMQEILQALRDERDQLKSDLEDSNGMLMQVQQERSGPMIDTHHDELLQQMQLLKEDLETATAEKSQLKSDLQDNVEMMIENQDELRGALEKVKGLQNALLELESQRTLMESKLSEHTCEMEKMKASITSLTEEREQIQQTLRREQQDRDQTMAQLKTELQSVCAERDRVSSERIGDVDHMDRMISVTEERDRLLESLQQLTHESEALKRDRQMQDETLVELRERLLCEENESGLEELQSSLASVSEEREQLLEILKLNREEKNQLRRDLEEKDQIMLQLREDLLSSSERTGEQQETLAAIKTAEASALAEAEANVSALTEERDRLLESLQVLRDEREQQETLAAIKTAEASALAEAEANVSALTEERDRLLESLQVLRDEREQIQKEQQEKSEMMELLRQGLLSACAERDRLMSERDAACNQSSPSVSVTSLSEGGDLQEILQGVRELIQVQGELKQKKHQESDPMSHKAQLQQIQALTEELESLRSRRERIQKDLQEAAATSKMYQDLLHVSKEELKQQQKEKAELMERSAVNEAQLQQRLSQMSEDLSALSAVRDQHNTEIQTLQTNLTSLTEEKDELLETLRRTREEREQLRHDLQESEHTLTHIESKAEQLEKQKILLESEVHSLSLSLTEVNASVSDQSNTQSKHRSAHLISEIDASEEKLQAAFAKLQLIVDRPTDALHDVNRDEWAVIYPLVQFIPAAQRNVHAMHTTKTTRLNNVLIKIAEAYRRLAQRCRTHFETEVQRDVASFEESRLQDLLVLTARAPAQASPALQDDLQQVWDQRLSHLVERRQQFLQKLECVLRVLEDGVAKHSVLVSEERQHRTRALSDLTALLTSPQSAAIVQLHEQQIARRTKAIELLNAHYIALLNDCESEISPLISSSSESERRLKDLRRETVTLLKALNGTLPKAEAELLQDNLSLTLRLQQTQKQMEEVLEQTKGLKLQADSAHRTHLQLQELAAQLKQKQGLIHNLEAKLKESEVLFKRNMTPAAAELAGLKDKLVKMELDHIAVSTSHEKEMAQMSSMLEHRADVIRKLKESLRKMQQDDEQSFADGDEFVMNLGSNTRAVSSLKEKMEELQKKNAQLESLVSKQQEELHKWKRRAYKIKESVRDAPCTPKKRQPPLSETELNSPKRAFLDSPKSKIFDSRSSAPLALSRPTQFFDNSSLGTVPESSAGVGSSAVTLDDWWQIPSASPSEPDADANVNANACPTQ
ncbi:centromere-associated protein E isoform X2 [Rhinichthys klamathensis goyatoka]|uniref:centromere-associated protein E isoform X2 n=1 Tax=Rhinichthys klamathensis goyatoka TaxID=3034132 RepID=UPI0024B4B218|nr:centromere-associated protein E isoform X2 [Rhinichthys klamathensis goyatoka]